MVLARARLIIYILKMFLEVDGWIYHFYYPKASKWIYVLMLCAVRGFDSQLLLSYVCLLVLILIISYSKEYE